MVGTAHPTKSTSFPTDVYCTQLAKTPPPAEEEFATARLAGPRTKAIALILAGMDFKGKG
jgi:hypothetical protein